MMKFRPIFLLVMLAICQWGHAETISSPGTEGSPASAEATDDFVANPIEEIEELSHQKQYQIVIGECQRYGRTVGAVSNRTVLRRGWVSQPFVHTSETTSDFCRSIFQNRHSLEHSARFQID